jgi:hypothetical protein
MRGALAVVLVSLFAFAGCKDAPSAGGTGPQASGVRAPDPTGSAGDDRPPRPPNPAELALIAPLDKGAKLADFEVAEVHGVDRGVLEIVCQKGAARIVLSVALLAEGGPSPPASTDRYAVFYSLRGAAPEDGERVAKALVTVLEAHRTVPPPPGLGPFVPRPVSL